MKEAKKLFYQYVFDVLSVEMLYADVWEGNINSIKSLESYGYKLIETRKELFSKTGKYALKFIFCLSKNDYFCNLEKEAITAHVAAMDESLNVFMRRAFAETMERDKASKNLDPK